MNFASQSIIVCQTPPRRPNGTGDGGAGAATGRDRWEEIIAPLLEMPDDKLARVDVAELQFACAVGLPGAEGLDPKARRQTLDEWTRLVRVSTQHWWRKFVKRPRERECSPGQFHMKSLVTVLQKHLGVHYDLELSKGDYNGTDSRSLFIHGLIQGHGGTCVSMPVLYLAVGRKLGYPLKLVRAQEHFFVRWEEPGGERFNIESTSVGFAARDDAYYRTWPKPIPEEDVRRGLFLRNLQPREELAVFLCERGNCLRDNLRMAEAAQAFCFAAWLTPGNPFANAHWMVTSLLLLGVEEARRRARAEGRTQINLANLPLPNSEVWQRDAAPHARRELERIAKIHLENRACGPSQVSEPLPSANHGPAH